MNSPDLRVAREVPSSFRRQLESFSIILKTRPSNYLHRLVVLVSNRRSTATRAQENDSPFIPKTPRTALRPFPSRPFSTTVKKPGPLFSAP